MDKGGRGGLHLACELGLFIVENKAKPSTNSDYVHPDLHYLYPTKIPKESAFKKECLPSILTHGESLFPATSTDLEEWLNFSFNKQTRNNKVGQVEETISVLNLKPFKSDRKVCVIWGLDYLRSDVGNKLLKIIENLKKDKFFSSCKRREEDYANHKV